MVYVLNNLGNPLMPTNRYAKIRILLKKQMAKVVNTKPFTIQLLYNTENAIQPISLGIDSGYLNIGFSAITDKKELISGEVKLLKGIKDRLKEKAMYRKQRRGRLRYRKTRFDNRKIAKGWLAPSIQHKLDSHIRFIEKLKKLLPISKITVEVANFDIQKIKNPSISGKEYQEGEQKDFFNLREYVFHRDNHKCQNPNCTNKDKNPILRAHHIKYKSLGGTDSPNNLITLCNKCHTPKNHKKGAFLYDWCLEGYKVKQFKDSTFMSIVRWRLVDYLNSINIETTHTYGYTTKSNRIKLKLEKTHYNDAFCIVGGTIQKKIEPIIYTQIKRNNRSLEKFYDKKIYDIRNNEIKSGQDLFNGRTTRNKGKNTFNLRVYRGQTKTKGRRTIRKERHFYQPNDLVKYSNTIFTVKGTHNKGLRAILKENNKSIKISDLKPYRFNKGFAIIKNIKKEV